MKTAALALAQQFADPALKDINPILPSWLEAAIIALSALVLTFLIRAIYLDFYKEAAK